MKKVLNPLNYDPSLFPGEINTQPSLTIPDQTLSLREILDRYASGRPVEGRASYSDFYDEDNFHPDPRTLDLEELYQLAQKSQEDILEAKGKVDAYTAEEKAKKDAYDAKVREAIEYLEAQKSKPSNP